MGHNLSDLLVADSASRDQCPHCDAQHETSRKGPLVYPYRFEDSLSNTCISGFTGFDGAACQLGNKANVHVEPVCVPKREDDICILDNIYDPGNGLTCEEIIHRWSYPHNILIVMESGHEMCEGADALSAETDRVTSLYLSRGGFSIRH